MSIPPDQPAPQPGPIYLAVAVLATLLLIAIATQAVVPMYRFAAPTILTAMVWALYGLRRRLFLRPVSLALAVSALILHMLGAFGFYQHSPLPFSFDILVHFYFALVFTSVLHGALAGHYPQLARWQRLVITFFFMMGLAALHEVMEYGTYLILGEERGMLKPKTSYFFDTSRDLTNNLLGTLTALILIGLLQKQTPPGRSAFVPPRVPK